ncbi:MAG TPA: cytochrome c biogenesis protein ResB, partial [Anaeromyxobacteraceae bacterium]|nr:cytochrome c biogenesis protein ResB [Anaeromyxobacteraceae bacterium]
MRRLWAVAVSMRTTALLMAALAAILLLGVLLPQADADPAAYAAALRRGLAWRFLLEGLRLGHLATSPLFLAGLGAFLVSLAAGLADRLGSTVRRLHVAPPTRAQLDALLAGGPEAEAPGDPAAVAARAARVLETLGYRVAPAGPGVLWGVKHRLALLGFPVFHAAFFALALGGGLVWWTRDVVAVGACEGQPLASATAAVERRAPAGPAEPPPLAVERVDLALEQGKPLDLAVALRWLPTGEVRTTRVNH